MRESILKNFYSIKEISGEAPKYRVQLALNKDHDIFKGHFPGNPVTPGVCMMQIVKDLAEHICEKKLFLQSASNVKFMAIINPNETPDLALDLDIAEDTEIIKVKNTTSFGETIALKLSATYKIMSS